MAGSCPGGIVLALNVRVRDVSDEKLVCSDARSAWNVLNAPTRHGIMKHPVYGQANKYGLNQSLSSSLGPPPRLHTHYRAYAPT